MANNNADPNKRNNNKTVLATAVGAAIGAAGAAALIVLSDDKNRKIVQNKINGLALAGKDILDKIKDKAEILKRKAEQKRYEGKEFLREKKTETLKKADTTLHAALD